MEKPQTHPRMLVCGMICYVVGILTYFDILKECSALYLQGWVGWTCQPMKMKLLHSLKELG